MNPIVKLIIIILLEIIFVFETRTVLGEDKSPPYFVNQPPTTEILFYVETEDSPITRTFDIPCEAKGNPEPDYFWTKNGQIFNWTSQAGRITQEQGKGTLKIHSTKSSDVGQYQCFAENIWGIATSNSVFARKIELNSFRDEAPVNKEAIEGQPFSLPCQAPYGYPKPNVNWLIQDFSGKLAGFNDPRITVDPEGTLWFSNITFDDVKEDTLYACAVTSPYISEVKTGAKVILQVSSEETDDVDENEIAPIQQYVSKPEQSAVANKKTRLYCIFGGTPLPTITWYKNDKLIQFRGGTSSKDSGKSIEIKKVSPSDEGNYTCQASNGVGDTISHTISLKVLVEPRFTKKPESVTIDEDETVEFQCQAIGNPTPEIIWLHNGKPLSEAPFDQRRAVSFNSIIIEKLRKNDTGNYGCNATNSVGYVYQDAYVNVLAEPPNITQLPQDGEVIEGRMVTLSCRAVGSPKPRIVWFRDETELIGGRYVTTKSGDLTITNAMLTDTGKYTCLAQNKISSTNTSANLSVRQRTRIPPELAPSDTEIPAGETATFNCSAINDPSLKLTITWLRDGEPIDYSNQHFVQNNDNSLTIPKTNNVDSGMYTCIASTRLDEATAEATLIVQNVPNPPALISLTCDGKDAIVLWKNTGDNWAPIISYIVQYNTDSVSYTWEALPNVIPVTETSLAVTMAPWTNYTFRVLAVNKIGNSLPSEPSPACTSSPPEVPTQNPSDITIRAGNESKALLVSWKPMSKNNHNGPGFHYQVSWKIDEPEAEWENQTITNWETGEYAVPNIFPNTKYLVKVNAGNDLGQSTKVSEVQEYNTSPDTPFKNPENVSVRASNSTSLGISWMPMQKNDQNGPGFHYNISWKKDTPDSEWENQTISKWETGDYIVPNVWPNTKYLVKVTAGNDLGQSAQVSEVQEFNTPPDIPFKNPEIVAVRASNSTSLEILWKPMSKNDQNGPGFHYKISWRRDTPESEWQIQTITQPETEKYVVPNALPNTKYLVKITAGNALGQSLQASEVLEYNTPPDIPFKNPDNVTVQASNSTTLNISWKPMQKKDQNGPGFHYNISWKSDTPESEWKTQTISTWETKEYMVPNVLPYSKYFVQVTAGNNLGQSAQVPEVLDYKTPPDIPFKNPDNMTVQASNPTVLEIFWKPLQKNDQNGPGFHYNISWKSDTPESQWQSQAITQLETGEYMVLNVLPYEKYLVTVAAGNNLGLAKPSAEILACQTPPDIPYKNPENVTVRAIDPTTLQMLWKPMSKNNHNGPGFYYNISWKRDIPEEEHWQSQIIRKPDSEEYTIQDVLPYEKYLVTISTGNDLGPANQTSESLTTITPATIPFKNPDNVKLQATGPTTSLISWKPMPKSDHNGPGFYYNISWKIDAPDMEWESQIISESEIGECTIEIPRYEKHIVTVVAGNDEGQCNQTPISVQGYFEEDVPLEAPTNLTLVKILSSTEANISWNRVPKWTLRGNDGPFSEVLEINTPEGVPEPIQFVEAMPLGSSALSLTWKPPLIPNAHLTGYRIQYQTVSGTELGQLSEYTPKSSYPNTTRVKLSDLKPDTYYNIIIQGTTNTGEEEKYMTFFFINLKTQKPSLSDLTITKVKESKNESKLLPFMWLIVLLSVILLAIVIILIVIYLKKLNEGGKYIVREHEMKNRRPDWPEDSDFQEVMLPLKYVPIDSPALPGKQDESDMVIIPLN